jgi:hypothetical protein
MFVEFNPQRVTDMVLRVKAHTRQQLIDRTQALTEANQAKIRRSFGHEAPINLFVDGQSGKPLSSAQEVTLTQFHIQNGVVDAAHKMLVERSPYGPDFEGHYRDDHWVYVNNVRRDAAREGDAPIMIGPGDKVVIINVRPYARKIEGGANHRFSKRLTDRRPGLSVQAPNGVYEISARDLQRMYGTIATIRFAYLASIGGQLLQFSNIPRHSKRGDRGRFLFQGGPHPHNRSEDRWPALEIEMKTGF